MTKPKDDEVDKQQRGGGDANQRNEQQQQQSGRDQYQPGHGNRQSDQGGGKK